jgi:ubiquitin-conjugating enzyme E2 S
LTKLFHPNVGPAQGDICVNTLKQDWAPAMTLGHVLQVVRCLLIVPFPESSLNAEAGRLFMADYPAFTQRAALLTRVHARPPVAAAGSAGAEAGAWTGGAGASSCRLSSGSSGSGCGASSSISSEAKNRRLNELSSALRCEAEARVVGEESPPPLGAQGRAASGGSGKQTSGAEVTEARARPAGEPTASEKFTGPTGESPKRAKWAGGGGNAEVGGGRAAAPVGEKQRDKHKQAKTKGLKRL